LKIKSQKDFFSGLMFVGVGIAFAWGASSYKVGNAARMGPGYFPLMLGTLMAILGLAITFKALALETEGGDKISRWAWKPILFILGSNFVFGVLLAGLPSIKLPAMGMVAGTFALTLIASLADPGFKLRSVLILATLLGLISYLAFVLLLKLPFSVWPPFNIG
jgi:hypothetical protein